MGLEQLKEPILKTARQIILEEGDLAPMVFFSLKQEVVGISPLGVFAKEVEQVMIPERYKMRVAMNLLGFMTRLRGIEHERDFDAVLHCSTAWTIGPPMVPKEEVEKWIKLGKRVSEHPKRVEVLILIYSRGIEDHDMEVLPFYRTPDGPVFEPPMQKGEGIESVVLDNFWRGYELKPAEV